MLYSAVAAAKAEGLSDEETLGTVLLTLTGSTLLVGRLIVAVGACSCLHSAPRLLHVLMGSAVNQRSRMY